MAGTYNIEELDWCYLGEGNSSIVYSSAGQNKLVLRVKKHYVDHVKQINKGNGRSALENDKMYVEKVLKPLLIEQRYFVTMDVVKLSEEMKKRLKNAALATKLRPDERKLKYFLFDSSAMLLPHLGFYESVAIPSIPSSSYAVEIKPKWGFLPKMTNTPPGQNLPQDFTVCRFCICQYLKLKAAKIASISPYCPLDLFANCSCRLKRALNSLFKEPQNNLRVFHDGMLIYSGLPVDGVQQNIPVLKRVLKDISSATKSAAMTFEALINTIASIFIHDSWQGLESQCGLGTCTAATTPTCRRNDKAPFESNNCVSLGTLGILKRIVTLQKIGNVDASAIKSIIDVIRERGIFSSDMENIGDFTSQQWVTFTSKLTECKMMAGKGSTEELFYAVQSFLVSATFKDCSIMITFKEKFEKEECKHEKNVIYDCISNTSYAYSIKLIDLDPKQLQKLMYYEQMDHDILVAYRKYFIDDSKGKDL